MPRLFLALELPNAMTAQLCSLQAAAPERCRLVPGVNMHLTLVFISNAEQGRVQQAVSAVRHPPVPVTLCQLECLRRGTEDLYWYSVEPHRALFSLRECLIEALQQAGLAPDSGTFRPHITLARCKGLQPIQTQRTFLKQQLTAPMSFQATHFSLYSSETQQDGPVYRVETRYPLSE